MSMHISARPGEIAERVLMPGDPMRAKYIAEKYLQNAVCINEIRGMYGYTGEWKGQKITVMASGMGTPSLMIYMTELCREYGAKRVVRIGTCGAVKESLQVGDLVISTATSTTSGINLYDLPGTFAPAADFELADRAYHLAKEAGICPAVGTTLCNDHLYVDNKTEYSRIWERYGILASEQEGAGLYTVAAREGVQALMLLTIVINLYHPEIEMSAEQKEKGLDQMITIGLDTLL